MKVQLDTGHTTNNGDRQTTAERIKEICDYLIDEAATSDEVVGISLVTATQFRDGTTQLTTLSGTVVDDKLPTVERQMVFDDIPLGTVADLIDNLLISMENPRIDSSET